MRATENCAKKKNIGLLMNGIIPPADVEVVFTVTPEKVAFIPNVAVNVNVLTAGLDLK